MVYVGLRAKLVAHWGTHPLNLPKPFSLRPVCTKSWAHNKHACVTAKTEFLVGNSKGTILSKGFPKFSQLSLPMQLPYL